MPWTVADVDKHKKGLSESEKKKWVSIANGILDECQEMKQENCEQRAIKIANSKVGGKNGRSE